MKKILAFLIVVTCLVISCSKKDVAKISSSKDVSGDWLRTQVYANDYWGGALYWQAVKGNLQVRFSDGKYYRMNDDNSAFNLVGPYKVLSDSTIQIQGMDPADSSAIIYTISYFFDADGSLNLNNGSFEGIVIEKFSRKGK